MNFLKPKEPRAQAAQHPSPPLHHLLQQALSSVSSHFSNLLNNFQSNSLQTPLFYACISNEKATVHGKSSVSTGSLIPKNYAMSDEAIDERLSGVPVYALSNGSQEFVLVSGTNTGKNLGLFCFSEADAETFLKQMRSIDPSMGSDSQVVPVALNKIFQLKVDGVALRLIPEATQIKHALKERQRGGVEDESFPGVPVFQSRSLILRSQDKSYRPVFFRKEDLEKSLSRASHDQRRMNPARLLGDIQVATLEDIVQGMKDSSSSMWDDVVFIPPGFDVSTDPSRK